MKVTQNREAGGTDTVLRLRLDVCRKYLIVNSTEDLEFKVRIRVRHLKHPERLRKCGEKA